MRTIPVEWKGRQVEAAWPEPIARAGFELSEPTIRATARAAAAVEAAGSAGAAASEVAARLLLRAEGLSSSMIEGIAVTPIELAVGEADPTHVEGPAAWVAANLYVVDDALAETGALTPRKLLGWHRRLMTGAPTIDARHVGAWRDTLVWVGGANPLVAAHVGTPAELVPEAMADLIAFTNRIDLDPITLAAVAHAHFETIHPFADGNGRIGRVLVSRTLAHGVGVATPPPVSVRFARDIGGYLSGLAMYQQDLVDPWVRWFAECVTAAATGAADTFAAVERLRDDWAERCAGIRPDSAVWTVLDLVGTHPVLSAARVAALTDVSERTARTALAELAARGVLTEVDAPRAGRGRPTRWWVAANLLALAGG